MSGRPPAGSADQPPATPCVFTNSEYTDVLRAHEQPVAVPAAEAQVRAALGQVDAADQLAVAG